MIRQFVISFGILGICLVIHIIGIVFAGERLVGRRQEIEQRVGTTHLRLLLVVVFCFIVFLHLTEACIWAAFYYWQGFFQNFETALYFSLKTYSTVGYGDVLLPKEWRLLGNMEGLAGVLLCGLSTAFLFAVVSVLFRIRIEHASEARRVEATPTYVLNNPEKS